MYYNKHFYTAVTRADHISGPRQGEWTYNHYAAIPDDGQRYEVIDGILYVMPSLHFQHQTTLAHIIHHLFIHVEEAHHLGTVYPIPLDVELSEKTVVQPDLLVIFNEHWERVKDHVIGAPDLVVEIAFPGSVQYDHEQKYHAYTCAGVNEYWIVDLTEQNVEVLVLEGRDYFSAGTFRGEQPVRSPLLPDFSVQARQFFELRGNP